MDKEALKDWFEELFEDRLEEDYEKSSEYENALIDFIDRRFDQITSEEIKEIEEYTEMKYAGDKKWTDIKLFA